MSYWASVTNHILITISILILPHPAIAQEAVIVEIPDPAMFFQNTTFAVEGDEAYVPSFDNDTLWSFSTITGAMLDPDGLALPSPGTASDATVFPGALVAVPGWFPSQGIFVADVTDPTNLVQAGIINFPSTTNIQGQNIEVDDNGETGYIAGFPDDTLYSFNVQTMSLQDPDGVGLPGNPDRIALGGNRVAMVDTVNGRIMVADVSDPSSLVFAGVIELPGNPTFGSNDNIVIAPDNRTGFVTSNQRVLYSFDIIDLQLLDPTGLAFGNQSFADSIALANNIVACIWSRGLAFVDVSDPTNMSLLSEADFGGTIAPQGNAAVTFNAAGSMAAMDVIFPANLVYAFDVATGARIIDPFPVDDQPNFLTRIGDGNRIGVLCSGNNADNIWLIDGIFGAAETTLTSFQIVTGTLLDGELADLEASDDSYVHTRSGFGQTLVDLHNMEMIVSAETTVDSASSIDLTIESRIDEPAGLAQIRLRNWNTNQFESVGSYSIGNADQIDTINNINTTNYIDGSGNVDLSIKHLVFVPFLAFTFESFIDQVEIVVVE